MQHSQLAIDPVPKKPWPTSHLRFNEVFTEEELSLTQGGRLSAIQVAFETYGTLDDSRSNAVFVCHPLTGSSHVARHDDDDVPGWWDLMVGSGRPIDTDHYFVICANVLGGCSGTLGPSSPSPDRSTYDLQFPVVTVNDIVRVHRALLATLGISRLRAVIGGSLGGMQALEWFMQSPKDAETFLLIAATDRLSTENLAWNAVGRAAIRASLDHGGSGRGAGGLGVARRIGHLTYLSKDELERRFGRERLVAASSSHPAIEGTFTVEDYLNQEAADINRRFDALSYLYLTLAMDLFDPFADLAPGRSFPSQPKVGVFSFASDRQFGVGDGARIRRRLGHLGADARHVIEGAPSIGHDAFLADTPLFLSKIRHRFAAGPAAGSAFLEQP
jgi:homoserine O-acetyltransferase/O-succinyltransferase